MLDAGLHPAVNLNVASWFVLSILHALHVAGGVCANVLIAKGAARLAPAHLAERLHALRLYWRFTALLWVAMLVAFLI